jgi:hypothetical protein
MIAIIWLALGLLIGRNITQRSSVIKHTTTDEKKEQKNKGRHTLRVKKAFKKYFMIKSEKEVNPEDFSVKIKTADQERNKSSPETEYIALSAIWAHYQACILGLLEEDKPAPWEEKSRDWLQFITELIKEFDLKKLFTQPNKLKEKAIYSFNSN